MIQLQYSTTGIQNKALYVDSKYTGSLLRVSLTSSFTGDATNINAPVISNKSTEYGGWILYEIESSYVPTDSGQYDVNIYELETSGSSIWLEATSEWVNETDTWIDYLPNQIVKELLSNDRALVSGSDYDTTYKHQFEEQSNFTVYNG